MNILVVEDNPVDLKLLSAVLQRSGHRVTEKTSAEQAMEDLKIRKRDLVLLDLKLPGMDGLELARRLKADSGTRHIVIVAITGETETFSRKQALGAGCDVYIAKPVDTRKLSDQLVRAAAR